jgi:integrase/recombinase XerC
VGFYPTLIGKGNVEREIELEKKGVQALKSYLAVRPQSLSQNLFLNYKGEPISERGIRKLVVKYRKEAGNHQKGESDEPTYGKGDMTNCSKA